MWSLSAQYLPLLVTSKSKYTWLVKKNLQGTPLILIWQNDFCLKCICQFCTSLQNVYRLTLTQNSLPQLSSWLSKYLSYPIQLKDFETGLSVRHAVLTTVGTKIMVCGVFWCIRTNTSGNFTTKKTRLFLQNVGTYLPNYKASHM